MSNENISLLSNRSIIAISGEDVREFLQGLITNDIHKATADNAIFAVMLSPQGKFLFDFFIIEHEGKLLLDVDKATQADLVKRLTMYKLRSKVEITPLPEMRVGWSNKLHVAGCKLQGMVKYNDPRLSELGIRVIGTDFRIEENDAYDQNRLSLGVPEGGKDFESNGAYPMQWGYDRLNAIDFNKGCYVGQEVTARSKHIGTLRKMVHKVTADTSLPARGTPIMAGEQEAGKMGSSAGNTGLALLNLEAVQSDAKLYSGDVAIKAILPAWAERTDQPA